jgi:hypothetical protein
MVELGAEAVAAVGAGDAIERGRLSQLECDQELDGLFNMRQIHGDDDYEEGV